MLSGVVRTEADGQNRPSFTTFAADLDGRRSGRYTCSTGYRCTNDLGATYLHRNRARRQLGARP